jgi:uncharacterized protein
VKLVISEPESEALERWLGEGGDVISCALARTEVLRAVSPSGAEARARARSLLGNIELTQLHDDLLDDAGALEGPVRSLDAIHLAAALELGAELDAVVTYDERMARAAESLGLRVVAPA